MLTEISGLKKAKIILSKTYGKHNYYKFTLIGIEYLKLFLKIDLIKIKSYVEYLTNIRNSSLIINIRIKIK